MRLVTQIQRTRPPAYDGKRKGVVGCVLALTRISEQIEYLTWLEETKNA